MSKASFIAWFLYGMFLGALCYYIIAFGTSPTVVMANNGNYMQLYKTESHVYLDDSDTKTLYTLYMGPIIDDEKHQTYSLGNVHFVFGDETVTYTESYGTYKLVVPKNKYVPYTVDGRTFTKIVYDYHGKTSKVGLGFSMMAFGIAFTACAYFVAETNKAKEEIQNN